MLPPLFIPRVAVALVTVGSAVPGSTADFVPGSTADFVPLVLLVVLFLVLLLIMFLVLYTAGSVPGSVTVPNSVVVIVVYINVKFIITWYIFKST